MVKINVTEKQVFFALCKVLREKQNCEKSNLNIKSSEGLAVSADVITYKLYCSLTKQGEDINNKQVWALLHKMIDRGLVNKKKVRQQRKWYNRRGRSFTTWKTFDFFELGPNGKEYVNKLRGK